jgi:uncharacterized protein YaaW (UPF0174 family)
MQHINSASAVSHGHPPPDMPYNDRLFQLLRELDDAELRSIWVTALRREGDDEEFDAVPHELKVALISAEWRAVHGHSLPNLWRDSHGLPWKRILIDVADKLKPGWGWTAYGMDDPTSEEALEQMILRSFDQRVREAWEAMSDEEKQKMASTLDAEAAAAAGMTRQQAAKAGFGHITTTSLAAGISAGLLSGAGAMGLASGAASLAVGSVLGGTLYQLGLWVVVRVFGWLSGAQLAASGGAAAVGGALLSAPAALIFLAQAVMSTSYRKTIPATLLLLSAHELRRQLATME